MELMEKFDNKRRPLNKLGERYHDVKDEYVQGVHVWIMNSKKELLVQRRNPNKRVHPNVWSTTGGGVDAGETTLSTAIRECQEELGISLNEDELELLMSYRRSYDFVDIYLAKKDVDIKDVVIQEEEVAEAKWVSIEEFENMIKEKKTSENVELYFSFFKELIKKTEN